MRLPKLQRLLTMTRFSTAPTSMFLRGVKTKSFSELKTELTELKPLDNANSVACQEVLNRVQVVTDVSDSRDIIENILAMGKPVAVDMEGIADGSTTGMVQVCDVERNISLFRTGSNPALYWEGGLAKLLEAPEVMKIMHASTIDCLSVYKDGVKLWNLYDTSLAFKVLDYQLHGTSIFSSNQIGFNSLCKHFGVAENPIKDRFKNILWKVMLKKNGKRGMDTIETLSDEVILYCAWDVEPLHQIHDMLSSSISPSYSHLVMQLSEVEIIRAIDPDLAKKKRNNLKNMELCNLFLSELPYNLTPPDLYRSLVHIMGHKHIYFSHTQGTANIVLDSREDAVRASKSFGEWGNKLGTRAKCKLVQELFETEVLGTDKKDLKKDDVGEEDTKEQSLWQEASDIGTKENDYVTHTHCKKLLKCLLKAGCPVVIEFLLFPDFSALEIYVGEQPSIKVMITKEMVDLGGLGKFLSSDTVKIVFRLDSGNVHSGMKLLNNYGAYFKNVFEICTAVKALDYLEHGQSLFKQETKSVTNMSKTTGLAMSTSKVHWMYMAYLHLSQTIPHQFQELLAELAAFEIGVGGYEDSLSFKRKRTEFKSRLDGRSLHLRLIGGSGEVSSQKQLKEMVMTTMLSKNIVMVNYMTLGRCSIVELKNRTAVKTLQKELEIREENSEFRFHVTDPFILQSVLERPAKHMVDTVDLEGKLRTNLDKLRSSGLTDL